MRFFCFGEAYHFWGLVRATFISSAPRKAARSFCSARTGSAATCSRGIIYGTRISLTIGLIGIAISFVLGITIGGMAGYFGGWSTI